MWWGGFSEKASSIASLKNQQVLIPMWWGGFSEFNLPLSGINWKKVLIPMWWGGFSEETVVETTDVSTS